MRHQAIRKALRACLENLLGKAGTLPVTLRDYQSAALASIHHWTDESDDRRAHVVHASGLGKSTLFAALAGSCTSLKTLVIVPTLPLLEQLARVLVKFTGGIIGHLSSLSYVLGDEGETVAIRGHAHQDVVIATIQSFNKFAPDFAANFKPDLIVYDECHRGYVETSQAALNLFPEAVILGFTATPDYLGTVAKDGYLPVKLDNGRVLYVPPDRRAEMHFGTLLDQRSLRWGIENGWLAPLSWGQIEFDVQLRDVGTCEGPMGGHDYSEVELKEAMSEHWSVMSETVRRLYCQGEYDLPTRQVVAICPSVEAATDLSAVISSLGIPSALVTGETPARTRQAIFQAFRAGNVKFLASVMVLREGWDAPNAEVCMMLRPTKSCVAYVQYMGRVLRLPHDGRPKTALVLDAHFQHSKLSPLSAPVLFAGSERKTIRQGEVLIGPRPPHGGSDDVRLAPVLPDGARPRIVMMPALDIERWADASGVLVKDGVSYANVWSLAKTTGLAALTIEKKVQDCRSIEAKTCKGLSTTFYAVDDVLKACADLLDLIQVEDDGSLEIQGIKWYPVKRLEAMLKISGWLIKKRLAACRTMGARDSNGHPRTLYALPDVLEACRGLLEHPRADRETGSFDADDETWFSAGPLAKKFGTTPQTLLKRIEGHCRTRQGREPQGKIVIFYCFSDAKKICGDLAEKPMTDRAGSVQLDGEWWRTAKGHERKHGISGQTLVKRMKDRRFRIGRDNKGRERTLYPDSDVLKACDDLIMRRQAKEQRE